MSTSRSNGAPDTEIAAEQAYVTRLYTRLDAARDLASRRLKEVLASRAVTPQAVGEREAETQLHSQRIVALDAAEHGLVFGRLDRREQERPRYIGRIGLQGAEENLGDEPLLVDWRAPAAQPFYTATPLDDQGVLRRRHIRTRGRRVAGISDELLDPLDPNAPTSGLTGESALLAALNATRTGRMTDIVRTIQGEQDRIIRADAEGVLVVQGGPGTGKTAVALHRAAYLLYTHRERLARRGLLVVGPTPTFLTYIGDVLPSLGETGVVLTDLAGMRPGLRATGTEPPEVAEVKGRLAMVDVLADAVRNRQLLPESNVEIVVDGYRISVTKGDASKARRRARGGRRLHNEGRPVFARALVDALAQRYAERIGSDPLGGANLLRRADVDVLREELAQEPAVHQLVQQLWPRLTAERFLREFFASAAQIEAATPGWSDADRALLHRPAEAPWTPADVALLEEADELIGFDEGAARAETRREERRRLREAQETLDLLEGSRTMEFEDEESEVLSAWDVLSAEGLASRQSAVDTRTVTERAAADRSWTYGHVVVDEAQELSAMAWRTVLRRVPTRSMTIVGDVAQTGSPAGATSWDSVLEPHLGDGWRLAELTINYRTPSEVMTVAAEVLAASGAGTEAPRSVRSTGEKPWAVQVSDETLPRAVAEAVAELAELDGTLAVLVPRSRLAEVRSALPGAGTDLTAGPVVLPPEGAKGLEFDSVLVVDPARIVEEGVRGWNDLYVVLTRATQRLGVVHPGPLLPELSGLIAR